jgi:hypothetical protein
VKTQNSASFGDILTITDVKQTGYERNPLLVRQRTDWHRGSSSLQLKDKAKLARIMGFAMVSDKAMLPQMTWQF